MARKTFRSDLGQPLGDGQFVVETASAVNVSDDVAAAVAALVIVDAAIADVNTTTDTADDQAALAVGALQTAVTDAVAAAQLIGAGDASAEIDAIDVAVQALIAKTAEVKTATAAAKVDAGQIDTTDLDAALTASTASAGGEFAVTFDNAVATSMNSLRRCVESFLRAAQASGIV